MVDLSNDIIDKYVNWLAFNILSLYHNLSYDFVDRYCHKLNWMIISNRSGLTEEFIDRYCDRLNWSSICDKQVLSEEFIEKHIYDFELDEVLKSKCLSEYFIERHIGDEDFSWIDVAKHQKLSDNFIKKHSDELSNVLYYLHDNWNYKSVSDKKQAIVDTGLYECYDDYFIAYKAIRINRYSLFNLQYKYEKGCVYDSLCDCSDNENSYGLNVGSECFAINYGDSSSFCYNVVRCKVRYEDVGRVVHDGQKIRCFRIEVLD